MTIRTAITIAQNLKSDEVTDEDKAEAVYMVLQMPSKMSITKDMLTDIAKWLFEKLYDVEELQ